MSKKAVFSGGIAAVLLLAGIAGSAQWRFGSLSNAIAYFDGSLIRVDQPVKDVGTVQRDERIKIRFNVTNLRNEPVRLAGAYTTCSCILPPEIPTTLEPLRATPLTFTLTCPSQAGRFEQEIELYFDGPIPAMLLTIAGVSR